MNILSLFDGISCGQLALQKAGIDVQNYFSSEIDNQAIKVTTKNFPNTIQLGDIKNITYNNGILYVKLVPIFSGKIDLVMGGSPCQGFSLAGKQLNFEDSRSKLFFEFVRLLKEVDPKYFLLENVKLKKEYENIITEFLGVNPVKINSSLLSAQNRERLYWTNIPEIVQPIDKQIMLNSIVGPYEGIWVYPRGFNKGGLQSYKGKSPTVTTSSWQYNFFIYSNGEKRKFLIHEVEQLQTIPIGYTDNVALTQRFKLCGNAWTVDIIAHILSFIKTSSG